VSVLSDKAIKQRIIGVDPEGAKEWWKKGDWERIKSSLIITPFNDDNLGTCSYDLSIGEQYISLRHHDEPQTLSDGQALILEPNETVLVLTREYVALPRDIVGVVVPRARYIAQGLALQATRVDATWFGKLAVALTNQSKEKRKIHYGRAFCTLMMYKLDGEVSKPLDSVRVPALGRERLEVSPELVVSWQPIAKEKVTDTDIDKVVGEWGPPFDVVRGGYQWTFERIRRYVEQAWGPQALKDMQQVATREAFSYLKWLTAGVIVALLVAVFALLRR